MLIDVTPGSRQKAREPWTLEKLYHERCLALGSAIDTSTLGPYNSALNSYITFCKIHNFPIQPTVDTMSYYTVFMSAHIKPESVSTYLSGICNRLENFFPDVREIRNSPIVSRTLKGCKRLKGSEVKRKAPLSREDIRHAIKTLTPSSEYDDALFLTILVTSFNGLLRLAELSMPDAKKSRNWRKVVRRMSVKWLPEGYTFFLPAHKADTAFEGNKVIIPNDDDPSFNPLPVFCHYLSLRDSRHLVHPALWITESGSVPTRSWFMKRLRQIFPSKKIAGQSMRAGGATDLAEQGILPYLIQARGHWSSKAFKIYIRKNPVLLQAMIDT